jgi:hypothetical protein
MRDNISKVIDRGEMLESLLEDTRELPAFGKSGAIVRSKANESPVATVREMPVLVEKNTSTVVENKRNEIEINQPVSGKIAQAGVGRRSQVVTDLNETQAGLGEQTRFEVQNRRGLDKDRMSAKEAYRALSHEFHGGRTKNVIDKRQQGEADLNIRRPPPPTTIPVRVDVSISEQLKSVRARKDEIARKMLAIEMEDARDDSVRQEVQFAESQKVSTVDFSLLPSALESAFESISSDYGSVRPSIIRAGSTWSKVSQSLVGEMRHEKKVEQTLERQQCFDLLDAITKSGGLGLEHVQLHVVLASSFCFAKSVMDTLVQENVNPIAQVHEATVLMASTIFNVAKEEVL